MRRTDTATTRALFADALGLAALCATIFMVLSLPSL